MEAKGTLTDRSRGNVEQLEGPVGVLLPEAFLVVLNDAWNNVTAKVLESWLTYSTARLKNFYFFVCMLQRTLVVTYLGPASRCLLVG
jgi:hypothetical protein